MTARWALAALLATTLLGAGPASAHTRSVSYSVWTLGEAGASVRLKLSALDHNAVQAALQSADDAAVASYLGARLTLARGESPCEVVAPGPQPLPADAGWVRFGWRVRCPTGEPARLASRLLLEVMPSHLHFARVADDGGAGVELLLSDRKPSAAIATGEADRETPGALDYLGLGVGHILTGADHLVFLFTLLLVAGRIRDVALAVTGFTVGHSVTLALAATGVASPSSLVIEALVGLTIAWVAAENVWLSGERRDRRIPIGVVAATAGAGVVALFAGHVPARVLLGGALSVGCYLALVARWERPERARWLVAAVFGLVHGFAFASVLGEHDLVGAELAWPLLGFNLGVELGQLAVVLALWPLWLWLRRAAGGVAAVQIGSASAMALGVFWFVSRAYSG